MSDALSFTEIDRQHIELLPARTVMSMLRSAAPSGDSGATQGGTAPAGGPLKNVPFFAMIQQLLPLPK